MFISTKFIGNDPEWLSILSIEKLIYQIRDTEFTTEVSVNVPNMTARSALPEVPIIYGYEKQQLHKQVPRALAIYYKSLNKFNQIQLFNYVHKWKNNIDEYFPDIQYGTKYFPCVLRQMKQLSFGRKNGKKNI